MALYRLVFFYPDFPGRIFEIVVKNLGFYVAYAYSQVPDAIFVGMGKTKYNAVNSLICNIVYFKAIRECIFPRIVTISWIIFKTNFIRS